MHDQFASAVTRREFFWQVTVALTPSVFLGQAGAEASDAPLLTPTPIVGQQLALTEEETSGPFFLPNSPAKINFREAGVDGPPIDLTGLVLDKNGRPLSGVLLDFWHADGDGQYDFQGFRCRGHQFTDLRGYYTLQTVVPGLYPGRTRHFHVRFQSAHTSVRSTQLYFPGEQMNQSDALFRPDLLIKIGLGGRRATFNFVVETKA
jgi:protocatechuate 3,4-dioxygenase beta subunit